MSYKIYIGRLGIPTKAPHYFYSLRESTFKRVATITMIAMVTIMIIGTMITHR